MTLAIDFETDWSRDYSVADLGAWAYCHDPRFRAYLVSFRGEDGWEWAGPPSKAPWEKANGYRHWISHNAAFDSEVFACLPAGIPKGDGPDFWDCTADLAACLQLPRDLAGACREGLGVTVDKSVRERAGEADLFAPSTSEMEDYALNDARLCLDLWERFQGRWPERERELSRHTRLMGRRGIGFDTEKATEAVRSLTAQITETEASLPWTASGHPPTSRNAFFLECDRLGLPRPTTTAEKSPEWQDWLDAHEARVPWVRGLNQWRKLNRTKEVIGAMLRRTAKDRLHYSLRYYGAAITGRWSGADGLNLQNLNSKDTAGGIDLRALLVPEPGKVFIVSDLSQIEPRCLAVLTGDEKMLEFLRTGADLYEAHARATMGYTDPRPLKEVDKSLRALAKARVLGLGYSCGASKFVTVAKIMAGLDISPEDSERIVTEYRAQNPKITALWDRMQGEFSRVKGPVWAIRTKARRPMRYYKPKDGQASAVKGRPPVKFYGGKLVENLIQATARDVLAEMILRIEAAGFPVVLHVHDEIIAEVPVADAPNALAEIRRIMTTPPDWMPSLPLECEATTMEAYGK